MVFSELLGVKVSYKVLNGGMGYGSTALPSMKAIANMSINMVKT